MTEKVIAEVQHDPVGGPVHELEPLLLLCDEIGRFFGYIEKGRVILHQAAGFMPQQGDQRVRYRGFNSFLLLVAPQQVEFGQKAG